MTTFVHIRDEQNVGDMASCPQAYFDFPGAGVRNYSDPLPETGPVILGGGTMVNWLRYGPKLPQGPKILWGAGSSRHGETEPWPDPEGFDLIGTREWSPGRVDRYAPCASCMSAMFDVEHGVTQEAVAFVNANPSIRARYPAAYNTGLPTMDNSRPMAEIVAFLASAETVVTNSYHGVLWATWLGKRVDCRPYSSKFFNLRHEVGYEAPGEAHPDALAIARNDTRAFYERVVELIG